MILYHPSLARRSIKAFWLSVRLLFKKAAATPACTSAPTWSFIKLTRGDTTMVMPGKASAGTW